MAKRLSSSICAAVAAVLLGGVLAPALWSATTALAATKPSHQNRTPTVAAIQSRISRLRQVFADNALPAAQRRAALDEALKQQDRLIKLFPDDPHQPIWETQRAEWLLVDSLAAIHGQAGAFAQFGVVSSEQQHVLNIQAPEALQAAIHAQQELLVLQKRSPSAKTNSGILTNPAAISPSLKTKLLHDYARQRTPFFFALAAVTTALLPDSAPYFARQSDPAATRANLVHQAIAQLKPFVDASYTGGPRIAAMVLTGRALLIAHQPQAAEAMFHQVLTEATPGMQTFLARLGEAAAEKAQGKLAQAAATLRSAGSASEAQGYLLRELLIADAEHRLLLDQSRKLPPAARAKAVAQAYAVYDNLLDDVSSSDPSQARAIRRYIETRWADHLSNDVPRALPPRVRLGIGRIERIRGQNLAIDAKNNHQPSPGARASADLNIAVKFLATLENQTVAPPIRAPAMFNLALAHYWLAPRDAGNLLAVGKRLTDTADQMPDQPVAAEAIDNAVSLLQQMDQLRPRPRGAEVAYRRAATVLFDKFPLSDTADRQRLYFAVHILGPDDQWVAAANMLGEVSMNSVSYLPARAQRLRCLAKLLASHEVASTQKAVRLPPAPPVSRGLGEIPSVSEGLSHIPPGGPTRQGITQQAEQLSREAQLAEASASSSARKAAAHQAAGIATLVLADMAQGRGDTDTALKLLDGFDNQYAEDKALVREAWRKRILFLLAGDRLDDAAAQARRMIQTYPDDGASLVGKVLDELTARIHAQYSRPILGRGSGESVPTHAHDQAAMAVDLAKDLLHWATKQNFSAGKRLRYQLILVRCLRLAGKPRLALKNMQPLIKQFPDNAEVIDNQAATLFALGDHDSLIAAAKAYDKLITGLKPPFGNMYWQAWVRRLQINGKLNIHTDDIPLRIRQLRQNYPELGEEPYKGELLALEKKYAEM